MNNTHHSKKNERVLILGARGLVGSAIHRGYQNISQDAYEILIPGRSELNLLHQQEVENYFLKHRPTIVYLAAAKVGGIHANNVFRADFILENLTIQANVMQAALKTEVETFAFLGSSCIYPKMAPQPLKEECLLTGPLEQTNEPYAIAKIAGLKTIESIRRQYGKNKWFSAMPTNLYGMYDNFHPENSHVIPGLMGRMVIHQEKIQQGALSKDAPFVVWGSGNPKREFLNSADLARALLYLVHAKITEIPELVNIGSGEDLSIRELVTDYLAPIIGFKGTIEFDTSRPDGTPRKVLDISRIKSLGWSPQIDLYQGLQEMFEWHLKNRL
jgi:GDP-L-fucose synthase